MAYDQIIDRIQLENQLTKIANSIRKKKNIEKYLNFYKGDYEKEIDSIDTSKVEVIGYAIPSNKEQIIVPPKGQVFSSVKIAAIPYKEEINAAGGITVSIGGTSNGS